MPLKSGYRKRRAGYGKKKRYGMKKRMYRRRKYGGVKYFQERIQLSNIVIPANAGTEGGVYTFNYQDLYNNQPLASLFDLFSVNSITYEIRPVNAYSFGSSPTPAPILTYAIQDNPDTWQTPTAKVQVMDSGRSKVRILDTQKTAVIKVYQKLPQTNYTAQTLTTVGSGNINALTTVDRNRNKFKWYSVQDLTEEHDTTQNIKFGALRFWVELPAGALVPSGPQPLQCAEVYMNVRYCMKQQD